MPDCGTEEIGLSRKLKLGLSGLAQEFGGISPEGLLLN
jgi:hypothetical protein